METAKVNNNKQTTTGKESPFIIKNYDADGKLIEDLSKVVLSLELSRQIATLIYGKY